MAMTYDGGVVMGADSRTSTGSYVANRVSDKLTSVHDRIYCCRSGSAADTQAVSDMVRYYLDTHAMEIGQAPLVSTAAALFQEICYNNKDRLMASIICAGQTTQERRTRAIHTAGKEGAGIFFLRIISHIPFILLFFSFSGWDPKDGGSVYALPLGGSMVKQGTHTTTNKQAGSINIYILLFNTNNTIPLHLLFSAVISFFLLFFSSSLLFLCSDWACGGSGSTYVYGFIDANYRRNMSKDECLEFVAKAISHAMARDGSSGGVIRLATIDKEGVQRHFLPGNRLPYMPGKKHKKREKRTYTRAMRHKC